MPCSPLTLHAKRFSSVLGHCGKGAHEKPPVLQQQAPGVWWSTLVPAEG